MYENKITTMVGCKRREVSRRGPLLDSRILLKLFFILEDCELNYDCLIFNKTVICQKKTYLVS
jgi:hypothetical protein